MCLGVAEIESATAATVQVPRAVKPGSSRRSRLSDSGLEEILVSAATASADAPNRAVKRRVRQRLHKKLGSLLTGEEFGRAMDHFKDLEEQHTAAAESAVESTRAVPNVLPMPCNSPPIIAVPFFMPVMAPTMRPAAAIPRMTSLPESPPKEDPSIRMVYIAPEKPAVCESPTMSESTADDEMDLESISDLQLEWTRALTEGSATLPVERTFIQFNTRPHVHRRRSKSV